MAEIVFPCQCGLLLKVHDNDQVGQGIVCPSCGSTVIVPAVGIAVDEPAPDVTSGTAAASTAGSVGKWIGLAYLGGVSVVTLGLIKFVLMPALPRLQPRRWLSHRPTQRTRMNQKTKPMTSTRTPTRLPVAS